MIDTTRYIIVDCWSDPPKKSWAEKERDRLVNKMKRRKANINKLIVAYLMLVSVSIILSALLYFSLLLHDILCSMGLGYCAIGLSRIMYFYFTEIFECDPSFVCVIHKGKELY